MNDKHNTRVLFQVLMINDHSPIMNRMIMKNISLIDSICRHCPSSSLNCSLLSGLRPDDGLHMKLLSAFQTDLNIHLDSMKLWLFIIILYVISNN